MPEPGSERSRGALFLMVALFAAAGLWFVVGSSEPSMPVVRGARAPDFALPRLADPDRAGEGSSAASPTLELASLAGRVVLVNFWATWCEPCEQEMPAMERLYQRLPRERFELVAVSIDDEDAKVAEFVERYSLSFPVVLDRAKQVSEAYQTMGVPESLLIDRSGHVVERYVGPREWDAPEYVERIESLFASAGGGPAPPSEGAGSGTKPVD